MIQIRIKLPSEYPPEFPVSIAGRLKHAFGENLPEYAVLIGAYLQPKIRDSIFDFESNRMSVSNDSENEFNEMGFYVLTDGEKSNFLVFVSGEPGEYDVHEGQSLALHVFSYLGYETVVIMDGVKAVDAISEPIIITDHINLTGINPLDYWMKVEEANPFFIDMKELYVQPKSNDLKSGTHIAVACELKNNVDNNIKKGKAICYGESICPESILAGYLGMKVLAIGFDDSSSEWAKNNRNTIFEIMTQKEKN